MNRDDLLDVDVIEKDLRTELIGTEVLVFNSTSSTNDIAWEYAKNENNNGLAVFAEEQTAGRGRRGNQWLSGTGESVLCSILLLDRKCGAELLTLASAVAVTEAISQYAALDAKIKWPNDIVINSQKVAGILLESQTRGNKNDYVIGIGINCHQKKAFFKKTELQMPATSIDIQSGKIINRNMLAGALLRAIDKWIKTAENTSEMVIEKWQQMSSQLGHRITVQFNQDRFTGNCIGVDPAEGLILQLENGGVRMFDAAHTTIIKHL